MTNKTSVVAIILSLAALGLAWQGTTRHTEETSGPKMSAFDRVMKTRTIRCAYASWPPYFVIEPNTKAMSGINYEIMQEVGHLAGFKIEWVEEVGYGTFPDNLRIGKEDAFCSGARQSVSRAQGTELSSPYFLIPLYPFVREGDNRFDGNIASIDSPDVTIASIDGSAIDGIAKASFPRAKRTTLPEMVDAVQILADVSAQKADMAIGDGLFVGAYNVKNPEKALRQVSNIAPLKISGSTIAVGKGEWELRDLINVALMELQGDGTIDRLLEKYQMRQKGILPVAKLYQVPTAKN